MAELKLGKDFYIALTQMANKFGISPEDFLLFFVSESALDSKAGYNDKEPKKQLAAGLSQIMSFMLPKVGFSGTVQDFSLLPAAQQVPYIEKYMDMNFKWVGAPRNAVQLYIINFTPVAMLLPGIRQCRDDAVFINSYRDYRASHNGQLPPPEQGTYHGITTAVPPAVELNIYNSNRFDLDNDGAYTYGDMKNHLEKMKGYPNFQQALKELHEATGKEIEIPNLNNTQKKTQEDNQATISDPQSSESSSFPTLDSLKSLFSSNTESNFLKIAYIRKLPNGKYRVFSEKGKNMGTYDSKSGAKNRLRQVEYFKHNADDGMMSIDLTDVDEMSYSSIMRKLNEKHEQDFIEDFTKTYKQIFDELYLQDKLNIKLVLKITLEKLKEKYDIKLSIKKEASDNDYIGLGKTMADMVLFMVAKIKPENRQRSLSNLISKIYYLNEHELASKKLPAGASIGNSILLCKTMLMGREPSIIRAIINNMINHLKRYGG